MNGVATLQAWRCEDDDTEIDGRTMARDHRARPIRVIQLKNERMEMF